MPRRSLLPLLLLAAASVAFADADLPLPEMSPAVRRETGRYSFELLPKSFQKNPQLEMTAVTELTDYGKTLPTASPEKPVYYFGSSSGYLERGEITGGIHPPDPNYLGRLLARSLQTAGFRPATNLHPPSLALFFHWGNHSAMDYDNRQLFPEKACRELLERAVLVGGHSFQAALARHINYGELLLDSSAKLDFLTSQAASDLYFVVVSAYDFAALSHGERRLVWRSTLTVSAAGVSMAESLPALILTGGPYFGHATPDAEILFRRVQRGKVELGPAKVIQTDVPLSPKK